MGTQQTHTRRNVLKTGIAAAAAVFPSIEALGEPKQPGETRVIYFGGDYVHNGVAQERYIRRTFAGMDCRMFFVQASRFLTPDVFAKADLIMMTRIGTHDPQGFCPDGLVEHRPEPDMFMNPDMEDAIDHNVRVRGMGFIAFHCTLRNPDKKKLMALLGCESRKGSSLQDIELFDFNPNHPITQGFSDFKLEYEENQQTVIEDNEVELLFKCKGAKDGLVNTAGWCISRGNGRVVALLPGHSSGTWSHPQFSELYWRAAHWALKREIPPLER